MKSKFGVYLGGRGHARARLKSLYSLSSGRAGTYIYLKAPIGRFIKKEFNHVSSNKNF